MLKARLSLASANFSLLKMLKKSESFAVNSFLSINKLCSLNKTLAF